MSVNRWLCLLTEEEYEDLNKQAEHQYLKSWFEYVPSDRCFEFGETKDENVRYINKIQGDSAIAWKEWLYNAYVFSSSKTSWDKIESCIYENIEVNCYFWCK